MGAETAPTSMLKTTASNSGTIWPLPKYPRSTPYLPDGHWECFFARFSKLFPFFIFFCNVRASLSVLTRI